MSTMNELMQKHFKIWSETDHERRRIAIDEIYSENCHVYDPSYANVFVGRDALMTLIDEVQGKFPGFVFTIIPGSLDEHHGHVRISWYYGSTDKPQTFTGQEFMIVENGSIHSITVFFDAPAE
ncbi:MULTISPECIES: nuclear transport factor 2 family protein [Paenibacillus]|uniref:nuclear transport factor 2 family protein n=1 Tax=Paenibacillus TaxID=44249 RepID=UPI0020B8BB41|nr:nuclear transport factor 2 family protein [Paenibacillus sp. CH40]MCP3793985.1 nuclear transport factor 2 family protein [Paenibacillus sp. CH40]